MKKEVKMWVEAAADVNAGITCVELHADAVLKLWAKDTRQAAMQTAEIRRTALGARIILRNTGVKLARPLLSFEYET